MDLPSVVAGAALGALTSGIPLLVWIRSLRTEPAPSDDSAPAPPPPQPTPDLAPVAVFYVDATDRIQWATRTAQDLFGSAAVGRLFETVLPDWQALESQRAESWTSPSGTELGPVWRLYATCADDTAIPVRVQRRAEGDGWWVCLRDMTQVNRRLERLSQASARCQAARDEAEHASRAKSIYLTGVAQVLRTPLNTIVGYGELVGEELKDRGIDDLAADVDRIHAASSTLHTILEAVLDWTEIEAGRMSVQSTMFELSDTLFEVVDALNAEVEEHGNTLSIDVPEGLRILGDPKRTAEIVGHLLRNASRYTESGAISIAARRVGGAIVIAVTDTGRGMVSGELEELFVGFEQRASRKHSTGTGISLLLAHTFAKMMGGSLTVSSLAGEGSTFMLELPGIDETEYAPPMML